MTRDELPHLGPREAARNSRLLLTVPEAATALGLSRSKVYELITRRAVRSIRIDGSRRVPIEALEAYITELLTEEEEMSYGAAS